MSRRVRRPRAPGIRTAMFLAVAMTACEVEESSPPVDAPPFDTEACNDAPLVTWDTFGRGFVVTHCQGCHASTATNRRDAPEHLVFDTAEDVARAKAQIVESAGGDTPRMPPNGGTTEEDRARLRVWLQCFAD